MKSNWLGRRWGLLARTSLVATILACSGGSDDPPSTGGAGGAAGTSGTGGATTGGAGGNGGSGARGGGAGTGATSDSGTSGAGGTAGRAGSGGQGGSGGTGSPDGSAGAGGRDGGVDGSSGRGGSGGATDGSSGKDGTADGGGSGGASGRDGSAGSGGTGGSFDSGIGDGGGAYPCNGSTAGYDAIVTNSGGTWTAVRATSNVYTGTDMAAAMQAAINSLTSGRTSKQSVLVQGSGTIPNNKRVSVTSYTVLNVCGVIDVTSAGGSGDMAPIYSRGMTDVEIPNVAITGAPLYGMFFRDVENLTLGNVDMRLTGGLGIRVDNHGRSDRSMKVQNFRLDNAYIEGASSQGVETYGVNKITIGTVKSKGVGECGLLLNDSTNAEVGLVDAEDTATGNGYAAFRTANRNGRINDAYPTNIHVGQVIARRGGRGIFCVSESGGLVIDRVDIADTGNNSILLENCYNVNIAAISGSIVGGGDVRIAARTEFANSRDITLQNLTVNNTNIVEDPCADNSTFANNTLLGSAKTTVCP